MINLLFYFLAWRKKGWRFTLATFIAVAMVSVLTCIHGRMTVLQLTHPLYAALVGEPMLGVGLLILFRHQTSLGSVNIVALYLQDRFKWQTGYVLLAVDMIIVLGALAVADVPTAYRYLLHCQRDHHEYGNRHEPPAQSLSGSMTAGMVCLARR